MLYNQEVSCNVNIYFDIFEDIYRVIQIMMYIFIIYILEYTEVELTCSSNGYKYATCDAGGLIHDVILKKQVSNSACKKDKSFGYSGADVWVDKGCRAIFSIQLRGKVKLVSKCINIPKTNKQFSIDRNKFALFFSKNIWVYYSWGRPL